MVMVARRFCRLLRRSYSVGCIYFLFSFRPWIDVNRWGRARTLIGRTLFFTVVSFGEGKGGHDSVIFHTTIQTLNTPTSVCLNGRGPWCECILCCRHRQDQTVQNKYKLLWKNPQRSSMSAHGHFGLILICRNLRSPLQDLASVAEVVFVSQRNCEMATSQEQCQCRGATGGRNRFYSFERTISCSCVIYFHTCLL